ncbi:hypothetical protein CNMCM8980_010223 [Aspergillus fumigatiaffinis]|uniref:Uncharacterized protein n=1 Tax=Aspergillus fumigatiaffinis TaxID=340414 RepID=A0A8H4HDU7_9EURO|nr:hypothetical protein CNMCM5878_007084 [Aspergillus fumigatiaffinis]KAF4232419.1 hypothetical protein CNMCM6805_009949 [Aspergillus fumigatiaffinis]KAF4241223.1 hypothetical protein CNMCM6457_006326 [Aspergillus fumigatiaffinis]KAF4244411.1 hypothetical protein CNMCM8980_010223 [Aspergillus fumigatiaffinis]
MSKPTLNPQTIQNRISHLLKHWPTDAVRPASVSVQTYLQSRVQPTQPQQAQSQQAQPSPKTEISEASLNALSSLLEDRYARRYPLPPKLRRPATNPDHYDNVVKDIPRLPQQPLRRQTLSLPKYLHNLHPHLPLLNPNNLYPRPNLSRGIPILLLRHRPHLLLGVLRRDEMPAHESQVAGLRGGFPVVWE